MSVAYIGVGSNVGDRQGFCRRAVEGLRSTTSVEVEKVSSLYETSPVGGPPQRSLATGRAPRDRAIPKTCLPLQGHRAPAGPWRARHQVGAAVSIATSPV